VAERRRRAGEPRQPPDASQALDIAAHFLGTRPRTEWELMRRLRRAGATDEVIEGTLARLRELGLADDLAFARWWAEQRDRHAPRGRRLLETELRQRGVPRDVLEELRTEEIAEPVLDTGGLPATELERARIALDRHLRGRSLPADRAALQRIGMFLVRRGFDPQTARDAIRQLGAEEDDPEDG